MIFYLFSAFTGAAFLMLSRGRSLAAPAGEDAFFSLVPIFWGCYWMIITYAARSADPTVQNYAPELLTQVALILFFYYAAGLIFGNVKPRLAVFFGLASLFFLTLECTSFLLALLWHYPMPVEKTYTLYYMGTGLYIVSLLPDLIGRCFSSVLLRASAGRDGPPEGEPEGEAPQ
ncbi:hypothetical protein LJC32_05045 [Oscillospiraceae bacterium OttesenSCG-928-F05]|nr:hypothetical protein [Oscillospiraceae bacterium OttesenSCG-928-F05]